MQELSPKEWITLVELALVSSNGFEELLLHVQPTLFNIARSMCSQRAEDLLQAGIIKIWRSLHMVDLKRPDSIKKVIISTGVHGMSDELRISLRRSKGEVAEADENLIVHWVSNREPKESIFIGLLAEYEQYIRDSGGFAGAHQHMAETNGMKIHLVRKRFHQEIEKQFGSNGE